MELRIGNLVFDHLGRVQKVAETREDAYICYLSNGTKLKYKLNTTNPIPLSEEWLLKLDFEKCEGRHGIYFKSPHDKQVRIYFYDEKWCIGYVSDNAQGFSTIGSFIHVHKLQNFHFEFVGQELQIK